MFRLTAVFLFVRTAPLEGRISLRCRATYMRQFFIFLIEKTANTDYIKEIHFWNKNHKDCTNEKV
jgi:hypothetical protein